MKSIILLLGLAAVSAGCKKHHQDEAAAPAKTDNSMTGSANGSAAAGSGSAGTMAAGSAAPAGAGSANAAAAADLPTSVDFEEQASKDVTDSNLEAKLSDLEKQLAN